METKSTLKNQNYITIAKALGIIFMVIGHSHINEYVRSFVYLFHMPLFFFCSGYFFRTEEPLFIALKKRFNRLYIPYFKWAIAIFLTIILLTLLGIDTHSLNNMTYDTHQSFIRYCIKLIIHLLVYMGASNGEVFVSFWFFKALFWASILILLIKSFEQKICKNSFLVLFFLLWLISVPLCYLSRSVDFKFSFIGRLDLIFIAIFFYISGFYWRKIEQVKIYTSVFTCLGIVSLMVIAYFFPRLSILFYEPNNWFFSGTVALLGIITTFSISYQLQKYNPKWLYYIGNKTLVIFTWHFVFFKMMTLFFERTHNIPMNIVYVDNLILGYPFYYYIPYIVIGIVAPLVVDKAYEIVKQKVVKKK